MTAISSSRYCALAERYGTPLYVYNGDVIRQRFRDLTESFSWAPCSLFYAMKANSNPAILHLLKECGASVDAVSIAEIKLALACGYEPSSIIFTANNVTIAELQEADRLGILCNIDSLSLLDRFGASCPGSNVCLRINPDVVAGAHKLIQTGGSRTKFGIALADLDLALAIVDKHDLRVLGIHKHTGSGITDAAVFLEAISNIITNIPADKFPHLQFFDFGGGFAVPYGPNDSHIDYTALGKALEPVYREHTQAYARQPDLYFEPGKFLVAESGTLLTEVTNVKMNTGRLIAGTNTGFTHLIRPVLYEAHHPILNVTNPKDVSKEYDIVGNICETGDRFAEARSIADIREGDILAITMAGAYCYTMASTYNLRPIPSEVLVLGDSDHCVRKGLTSDELVAQILEESSSFRT